MRAIRLQPGGMLLPSLARFSARKGFSIARTRLKDHPPQPPRFIAVAAHLGLHGEVALGQMAVDALIDAAKTVGTPQASRSAASKLRPRPAGRFAATPLRK